MARLAEIYTNEIIPKLQEQFEYQNKHEVPAVTKIVVSMGVEGAVESRSKVDSAARDLTMITGQKAVITKARKSVAGFRLREGMPIGCMTTLRRERMYEFLDRLIHVSLPRTRDFQGVRASGFDGRGNFSFGIQEQIIFPEIDLDKVKHLNGMHITIVTNARTNEEAKELLAAFGFPFKKN